METRGVDPAQQSLAGAAHAATGNWAAAMFPSAAVVAPTPPSGPTSCSSGCGPGRTPLRWVASRRRLPPRRCPRCCRCGSSTKQVPQARSVHRTAGRRPPSHFSRRSSSHGSSSAGKRTSASSRRFTLGRTSLNEMSDDGERKRMRKEREQLKERKRERE